MRCVVQVRLQAFGVRGPCRRLQRWSVPPLAPLHWRCRCFPAASPLPLPSPSNSLPQPPHHRKQQRVLSASVEVAGETVSSIGPGLLCLVGVAGDDDARDAEWLARQLLRCRAFSSTEGERAWDLDVAGVGGELLCVSQFTLHARFKKPKPDFRCAARCTLLEAFCVHVLCCRGVYACICCAPAGADILVCVRA